MEAGRTTLSELVTYAKGIDGTTLETRAQRCRFRFDVEELGFRYTPESTGHSRLQRYRYIEKVLERFNETRSLNPGSYQDATVNASYVLTVIAKYLRA